MHACPLAPEAIPYSLRQLTAEEERAYEAHLASCLACQLKVREVADTLNLLPLAVPDATPPPDLKAKVLRRVADAAKVAPARGRSRWSLPVWAAAAVVALAVASYSLMRMYGLQERLAGFEHSVQIERTVKMQGTEGAPNATGRVVVAREGSGTRIALQAQGLPPLQAGEAYQLWLIKDGKRKSGGVFVVDATGAGGVATWLPDQVEFDALGITREPDALGLQPRGPKLMGSVQG
ncbi:MAG TPA: anti-sigma factor [Symbiobacteriaceae bacterium]|nr:anti-sigma factor [Symbiobacteriaceae bacterium]